jgi:hypothetical protein
MQFCRGRDRTGLGRSWNFEKIKSLEAMERLNYHPYHLERGVGEKWSPGVVVPRLKVFRQIIVPMTKPILTLGQLDAQTKRGGVTNFRSLKYSTGFASVI